MLVLQTLKWNRQSLNIKAKEWGMGLGEWTGGVLEGPGKQQGWTWALESGGQGHIVVCTGLARGPEQGTLASYVSLENGSDATCLKGWQWDSRAWHLGNAESVLLIIIRSFTFGW